MVLLPAGIFSVLIIRAVRSDRVQAAQERADRQRQIVRLFEEDLSRWLFSTQPDAAVATALFSFRLEGDRIVFPEFDLALPVNASPPRPPAPTPLSERPTAQVITDFYYPRILVYLRDFKSGAQYFLRLKSLIVLLPGGAQGYALDAQQVIDRANGRLAELCAGTSFKGSLWIGDVRDKESASATGAFALKGFSFFQVVFYDAGVASPTDFRQYAFAYSMAFLVLVAILGSVLVYRTVSQEARLSQLRTDFVSAVSHEFRSPLSSMLALLERLESARIRDPEKLAEYHDVIRRDARRLSALVTRLLDFAQIENGKMRYALERVELVAITREALEACRYSAREARVRLCGADAAPLWVRADRTALRHCVQNLIENAIKYSPPDSPIAVTCSSANGSNIVEVQDRGIGIPRAEQEKIFEKFYRGHHAAGLNVQGVGIGLALVKHVAESHGGSVSVESEPGDGSRFRLHLPNAEG
ncbi:MAG: HAMP domain-containing histidine kinase [Acidobacteria bacterium]|nr:HAMP domain-containing histidine kinase [Acidobacteriota bacterium]